MRQLSMSLNKSKIPNGLAYLKPLHVLGFIFGLSPIHSVDCNVLLSKLHKCYCIFIIFVETSCMAVSFTGRLENLYNHLVPIVALMDGIATFMVTLSNVIFIYRACVAYPQKFARLLLILLSSDRKLVEPIRNQRSKTYKFIFEIVFGHVYIISYFTYDFYFWINTIGISLYSTYFIRSLQDYLGFLIVLLLRHYALPLKYRFEVLNRHLKNNVIVVTIDKRNRKGAKTELETTSKIYTMLCRQVDIFNEVFGYAILLLTLNYMCQLLNSFAICIVYFFDKNDTMNGRSLPDTLFVLCFLWIIKDFVSSFLFFEGLLFDVFADVASPHYVRL